MNFKFLIAMSLLLAAVSANPAFSADQEEVSIFKRTGKCVDCNLSRINETNASLKNINVAGANLSEGSFENSDLRNANFSQTNSVGVNFDGSDLRNADFSYADVSKVSFCGADLRGVNWKGITYNSYTSCLPDEAKSVNNNSNDRYSNNTSTPNINSRSLKDEMDNVKVTTQSVKDIINLF